MRLAKIVLIPSLFLTLTAAASAQATRTWISGVGDDVNPCSRTAPCKTFAGAISKTAAGGEIDTMDPGGFGTVTITKSITLDGGGWVSSILSSGTNGININAGAGDTVTLRNLTINGAGTTLGLNGVNILNAANVHLENVVIQNFSNSGVSVGASGAVTATLDHVLIRDISGPAIAATGASSSAVASVNIKDSSFQTSSTGVNVGQNAKAVVTGSTASGNTGAGYTVNANGNLTVVSSSAGVNAGAGFAVNSSSGNPTLTLISATAASNTGAGIAVTGTGTTVLRMTGSALLGNGGGIAGAGTTYLGTYGDNEITNGVTGVTTIPGTKQ
ncbi:right-handed parallel beta-helix repeat-containing protein [Terriglobus sp. RCC_193]|uniref:right-handed parallel beta-helix repeat-containing protein n=1 Tax=Terriglobus sp. RCC_193 TaxID=3239218 RepID=UPI003526C185